MKRLIIDFICIPEKRILNITSLNNTIHNVPETDTGPRGRLYRPTVLELPSISNL